MSRAGALARVRPRRSSPVRATRAPHAAWTGTAGGALASRLRAFETYLGTALASRCRAPGRLGDAIRYSALSPGKRLRPLLAVTCCEAVGGGWRRALPAAAALECVHAFSLVHDDLPAMDDDDYRRGRLTTHKKHGEALAILAGDALLAFAFQELARLELERVPPARVVEAVSRLARASGGEELVGGQALDIAAEGRRTNAFKVHQIHRRKTGALLGAAMALGGIAGGGTREQVEALDAAGHQLGLAFQIHDDLLNVGSSLRKLGKRPGTDAARGKATYPGAVGAEKAHAHARAHFDLARFVLEEYRLRTRNLDRLLDAVAARER